MAASGSLLFSRESGIIRSSVYSSQHKGRKYKGQTHFFPATLSFHSTLKELSSVDLLTIQEPLKPMSARCNIFVCRALFSPNGGNQIPILKTAATVLARWFSLNCVGIL